MCVFVLARTSLLIRLLVWCVELSSAWCGWFVLYPWLGCIQIQTGGKIASKIISANYYLMPLTLLSVHVRFLAPRCGDGVMTGGHSLTRTQNSERKHISHHHHGAFILACRATLWTPLAVSWVATPSGTRAHRRATSPMSWIELNYLQSATAGKVAGWFVYWQEVACHLVIQSSNVALVQLHKYYPQAVA